MVRHTRDTVILRGTMEVIDVVLVRSDDDRMTVETCSLS